jgi:hypothetical protein
MEDSLFRIIASPYCMGFASSEETKLRWFLQHQGWVNKVFRWGRAASGYHLSASRPKQKQNQKLTRMYTDLTDYRDKSCQEFSTLIPAALLL